MANDEDEEIKDPDMEENDKEPEDIEIPEAELLSEKEPDLGAAVASSSFADDDGEDEEDPYESFNAPVAKDDSQLDPYGVGAPSGFGDGDEEDFLGEDEDDVEADDSNAF